MCKVVYQRYAVHGSLGGYLLSRAAGHRRARYIFDRPDVFRNAQIQHLRVLRNGRRLRLCGLHHPGLVYGHDAFVCGMRCRVFVQFCRLPRMHRRRCGGRRDLHGQSRLFRHDDLRGLRALRELRRVGLPGVYPPQFWHGDLLWHAVLHFVRQLWDGGLRDHVVFDLHLDNLGYRHAAVHGYDANFLQQHH